MGRSPWIGSRCLSVVTPVFKKGNKSDPGNYRPIPLISVACKILEHVIHSSIINHFERHTILRSSKKNCLLYPYLLTFNPPIRNFFWHFWKIKLFFFLPHFHQEITIFPLCSNEKKKKWIFFFPYLPTYSTKKYRVGVQQTNIFLRMA